LNQLIDRILELPKLQKIAILGVVIILAAGLYYSFLHVPLSDQIAKLADSVEIAKNEKLTKFQKAASLPRLRQDLARLDLELKKAVAQLPDRKEVADLLGSISTKAQSAGLEILTFRPRAESFQEFYAEVPVDITLRATITRRSISSITSGAWTGSSISTTSASKTQPSMASACLSRLPPWQLLIAS
jgi:type IV pilus assembly protein PilO